MPPSSNPPSPTSRRRQSSQSTRPAPSGAFHSRRSSQASAISHRRTASRASDNPLSPGAVGDSQEPGDSLADELADAWDDENDDTFYTEEATDANTSELEPPHTPQPSSPVDSKGEATPAPAANGASQTSPSKQRNGTPKTPSARHLRNRSLYDDDAAIEEEYSSQAAEFPKELEQTIKDVEKLASQGQAQIDAAKASSDPSKQDPVAVLLASLQHLGNQSNLETAATRLITAHTSLSTHLAYHTRTIQAVSFPLLSPLSAPPPADVLDDLLPLLHETTALIPQPSHTSLNSLSHLAGSSRDAIAALAALSDSLHMVRQVEAGAARRLRSARDGVAEMRREYAAADAGQRFIADGGWDGRLQGREAASRCRDIVSGFEAVCGQMRARLESSAAAAAAAA